jgi:6-pyruvoyltetrahydropterin/6-carboxytetrahydropterin synthase
MGKYVSTKKYGHDRGLSCAFRQWRADSHCQYIHGYALAFEFVFESDELDVRNWVVDFGELKSLKDALDYWFDHTTIVAADDPDLHHFNQLQIVGLIHMRIMNDGVGCERVAKFAFGLAKNWLIEHGYSPRVTLRSAQVWEHGANSARYEA